MRKLKLTRERQERFLNALSETGSVTTAVDIAGTSRSRIYALKSADPAFASAWARAEDVAADRLADEARRRAVDGVPEPVVSAGKLVRDDDGQVVLIRRYSDRLLAELLRARRPPPRERSVHFHFPLLTSVADAVGAMASIAEAVAKGAITPNEATELSRIVEAYIKAVDASVFDRRLQALEAKVR